MCGIAGFCDYSDDLSDEAPFWGALAKRMGSRLKHRGPDDSGIHVSSHAALAHARLAVVDIEGGKQPMTRTENGFGCRDAINILIGNRITVWIYLQLPNFRKTYLERIFK